MIINHNMMAENANRMANINQNNAAKAMQQLSSGLRINSASDDAAGLSISTKMQGQINGLNQASSNAQTGVSMLQTADGALNVTTSVLARMRTLAVQSSSDTNTAADRSTMQTETNALTAQIDNIASTTQFNTKNLLDGSMGAAVNTAVANVSTSSAVEVGGAAATGAAVLTTLQDSNGNGLGIAAGDKIVMNYTKNGTSESSTLTVGALSAITDLKDTGATDFATTVNGSGQMLATADTAGKVGAIEGLTMTVTDATGNVLTAATAALSSFGETTSAADIQQDGTALIQIGANAGQSIKININDMGASALGVAGLQIGTQAEANTAIKVIDNATAKVSTEEANLGATENRLSSTIDNLGTTSQNLTTAQSQITDVDMASAMSTYSKDNVESQAAQAMIAQANQQPQQVLQLLR